MVKTRRKGKRRPPASTDQPGDGEIDEYADNDLVVQMLAAAQAQGAPTRDTIATLDDEDGEEEDRARPGGVIMQLHLMISSPARGHTGMT